MTSTPEAGPLRRLWQRASAVQVTALLLARILVALAGAAAGFVASLLVLLRLGPMGLLPMPFITLGGGWLAWCIFGLLVQTVRGLYGAGRG